MKKLISAVLAALMLVSTLGVCISAQTFTEDDTYTVGNADDSDDSVNAKDTYLVRLYLDGNAAADAEINRDAADLNADGLINIKDSMLMKGLISGSIGEAALDNGKQVYRFTIGGVDISQFCISVPAGSEPATSNAHYTGEILQKYIEVATGVKLSIVYGRPETGHAIIINEVDRWSELGEKLENENYIYEVKDGNLELYGTYRGNMYAAYEIIEDYLGFRFFDDTFTYLYKQRYVDIPDGTYVFFEPYLNFRHTGQNVYALETYYLPSRMNSCRDGFPTAEPRYGTFYGRQYVNAHSHAVYWRMATGTFPDESFGTLAERYNYQYETGFQQNELSWQPCATSNSAYKTLFKGFVDTIARIQSWSESPYTYKFKVNGEMTDYVKSGQPTFAFSLCDNEQYCQCRNCNKKKLTEGYSGLYLDLANRAVRDIQADYPGLRVHTILYNHAIPENVRPDKNLIVYYCGQGCNNHFLNSGECGDCKGQLNKENNIETSASLKAWGQMCAESGAEMWFWYYGVNYHYYLVGMPNIFNLYHDYKFLYEECNVKGINYEGAGPNYTFETLKAYLSTRMEWNPTMTYDEFIAYMKEYLYMYFGDGYEKIYEFIVMENEAGDRCGTCFVANFDWPWDYISRNYIAENYEYMRGLLYEALDMADRAECRSRIEKLICCFDFLGLSSSYEKMYTEGDDASRALYEERYTAMCNFLKSNNMDIHYIPSLYHVPETCDFSVNPMYQFYEVGSRRPGVAP